MTGRSAFGRAWRITTSPSLSPWARAVRTKSSLMTSSRHERDIIVVQNLVLLYAVIFVAVNVLVDLSDAWLDPRIRYS